MAPWKKTVEGYFTLSELYESYDLTVLEIEKIAREILRELEGGNIDMSGDVRGRLKRHLLYEDFQFEDIQGMLQHIKKQKSSSEFVTPLIVYFHYM